MSRMSKKEPQYIKNYASDGKKPTGLAPRIGLSRNVRPSSKTFKSPMLKKPICPGEETEPEEQVEETVIKETRLLMGPGPRIGLSRNVRPSPNGFKSPMLKPSPRYPNFSATTPTTPVTPQTEFAQKENLEDTPKEKPTSRVSSRKKAKKNLQDDFDGAESTEETNRIQKQSTKTEKNASSASKMASSQENKDGSENLSQTSDTNVENVSENKSLNIDTLIESPLVMEDFGGRRSSRVRVIRQQFVEDLKNIREELPKSKKTTKNNKRIVEAVENSDNEDITEGKSNSNEKKGRGRPKKAKIIEEDDKIEPPTLNIVTPNKNKTKTSSNEKDCPILSPQDVITTKKEIKTQKKVLHEPAEKTKVVDKMESVNKMAEQDASNDVDDSDDDDDALPLAQWSIIKRPSILSQSVDLKPKRFSLSLKRTSTNMSNASTASKTHLADENLQLEMLRNEVESLQQNIDYNVEKVAELEAVNQQEGKVEALQAVTKQWEVGCKEALIVLHQQMTAKGTNIDMDTLLQQFKAPQDCFKFDSFEYAFV